MQVRVSLFHQHSCKSLFKKKSLLGCRDQNLKIDKKTFKISKKKHSEFQKKKNIQNSNKIFKIQKKKNFRKKELKRMCIGNSSSNAVVDFCAYFFF